ncbi:MAG: helix-turn-helix domain-containing protein [Rhodospirillales bacterium]
MSEATLRSEDEADSSSIEQLHGGVGVLLSAARERLGEERAETARMLRINWRYLEAIEESRFERLPGRAYSVGFVRTYAEHLGLDADEVVRRFKMESEGVQKGPELIFPEPIPEGRLPGGAIVMAGAVIFAAAYGAWHFISEDGRPALDAAAPPPKGFTKSVDAAAASEPAMPDPAAVQTAPAVQPAPAPAPAAAVEIAEATPAPAPAPEPQPEPVQQAAAPQPAPVQQAAAPQSAPEPAPAPIQAEAAPALEQTVEQVIEQITEPAPEQAAEPATEIAAVSVAPAVKAGIVLRAKATSWVQIRDTASGQTIVTQVMREGDEIKVPDISGLVLLTGNAGALDIVVDGVTAPAVGGSGQIVRNVILQRDRLLAGTAAP